MLRQNWTQLSPAALVAGTAIINIILDGSIFSMAARRQGYSSKSVAKSLECRLLI